MSQKCPTRGHGHGCPTGGWQAGPSVYPPVHDHVVGRGPDKPGWLLSVPSLWKVAGCPPGGSDLGLNFPGAPRAFALSEPRELDVLGFPAAPLPAQSSLPRLPVSSKATAGADVPRRVTDAVAVA